MTRHILVKSRSRLCGKLESDIMHFCALNPFRLNKGLRTLFRLAFDKKFIIRKDRFGSIFSRADKKLAKVFNKKKSYYGGILILKKKIRFYFGVISDNFIFDQLSFIFKLKKKVKGLKLMDALARAFEMRMDFLSIRLRYFFSLKEARLFIPKGIFKLNGLRIFNIATLVKLGDILSPASIKSKLLMYKSLYLAFYGEYFAKSGLLKSKFISSLYKFYLARFRKKIFKKKLRLFRYYFLMGRKLRKKVRLGRLAHFYNLKEPFFKAWDYNIVKYQTNPILLKSISKSFFLLKHPTSNLSFRSSFKSPIVKQYNVDYFRFIFSNFLLLKSKFISKLNTFYENSLLYSLIFFFKVFIPFLTFFSYYFKIFAGTLALKEYFRSLKKTLFIHNKPYLKKKKKRRRRWRKFFKRLLICFKGLYRARANMYRLLRRMILVILMLRITNILYTVVKYVKTVKRGLIRFLRKVRKKSKKRRLRFNILIRKRILIKFNLYQKKLFSHISALAQIKSNLANIFLKFQPFSQDKSFKRYAVFFTYLLLFKRFFKSGKRKTFINIFLLRRRFKSLSSFFFLILLKTKGLARFKSNRKLRADSRKSFKFNKKASSKFKPFFMKKRRVFFLDITFKRRRILRLWTVRLIERLFNLMRFFEFALKKKIRFYRLRKREFSFFLMGQNYKTRRKFFRKYRRFKAFNYFKFLFFKFTIFMRKRLYKARIRIRKKRLFFSFKRFRKYKSILYLRFFGTFLASGKIVLLKNIYKKLRQKYKRRLLIRIDRIKKKKLVKII